MTWRLFQTAVERAAHVMKKCHRSSPHQQVEKGSIKQMFCRIIQSDSFMLDMTRKPATVNQAETRNAIQCHKEASSLSSVIQDQENLISYVNTLSKLKISLLQ